MVHLLLICSLAMAEDFDILIRNGRVVDGTGNPSQIADVGIKDQKIAAVGMLGAKTAKRVIDAAGLTVAPGFIDIHNHSDDTVLTDGNAQSMIRQGVTSMIFGEGGSAAPSKRFATFDHYYSELLKRGISTNVGSYVGSSEVWTWVRGPKAGPPSEDELRRMQIEVRRAMEDGALGVASSLSGPPGAWIDTNTLIAMCEAASPFGGIYSTHMRTEGFGVFEAVAEALEIGRKGKVPVDIIHLKIAEHKLWGKMPELIATIANARAQGQQVEAHVYPYRAGQNNLASIVPPWAHEGGRDAMLKRLQDASLKPRIKNEILNGIPGSNWYNHYTATGSWEGMLLVNFSNPEYKKFEGRRMSDVIAEKGGDPVEVLFRTLIDNSGSVPTVYFHHSEQDMRYALQQPFVSIGSDGTAVATEGPLARGNPHPRYYGTFPRVLGRYVREDKVLTMEEAIRKMTSANAAKIRIYDRGLLRAGQWGDVTVFDASRILDHATFDKPHQYAVGVEYVVVNGTVVLDRGKHLGTRPGMILRGQGYQAKGVFAALRETAQMTAARDSLPVGRKLGYTTSIADGRNGELYVLHRGTDSDAVLVVDSSGKVLRSWGKGLFQTAHSIRVDPQGNVWTVDTGNSMVYKWTPKGELLLKVDVGGAPQTGPGVFAGATDVAFGPDGRFYVSDGYRNARVLMYAADGKKLWEWGKPGKGPSEFQVVHAIAADRKAGRLYVSDRSNARVQYFDWEGRYLGEFDRTGRAHGMTIAPDGALWVATQPLLSPNGADGWLLRLDTKTGRPTGWLDHPGHSVDVLADGSVVLGNRAGEVLRFRRQ